MPFQYLVFILLASSDSDKHMLMRQKVYTKIRLYWTSERLEKRLGETVYK